MPQTYDPTAFHQNVFARNVDASGNPVDDKVQGNVAHDAVDGGSPIKTGGFASSAAPAAVTTGDRVNGWYGLNGQAAVAVVSSSGAFASHGGGGSDGMSTTNAGLFGIAYNAIFNGATWDRQKKPNAAGKLPSSAASTNATPVKASAGDVFSVIAMNTTATVKFLKIYNKASAPIVGTDIPVLTIPLPPTNQLMELEFSAPLYCSSGIAFALTGAAADGDATALASGDVVGVNILFQ